MTPLSPVSLSYTLIETGKEAQKKKPYLFFIHGSRSNGDTWKKTVEALKDKYEMVVIHLRGHGSSPYGNGNFSTEQMVADIKLLVDRLKIAGKIVIVAHSMGSRIANLFCATYPKDVLGLVIEDLGLNPLEDPILKSTPEEIQRFKEFSADYKTVEEAQNALDMCGYPRSQTTTWTEDGRIRYDESRKMYHVSLRPYVSYLTYTSILAFPDQAFEKMNPSMPVALLGAEMNSYLSIEQREKMQKLRPNMQRYDVPSSEHSIHKSNLNAFIKILTRFIDLNF